MTTETRVLSERYELGERLGDGGMATVYAATDLVLGRRVAVKVLDRAHARDVTFVERFRREAQAAAGLNHPNVVAVYDTGSDDGTHYIVMEHVEGETLAGLLAREGRLPPGRAALIGAEVCDGLAAAHAQGLVHRDVKPGNVLLTRAGGVKVADFGIARAASTDPITMTGTVMGTASYLSPEQARGEPVDARSDIYALGCVLYEMLTGAPPFTADSPVAVASQHVEEVPLRPSASEPSVPANLEAVVLRALEKLPEDRFPDAPGMARRLRATTGGEETRPIAVSERTAVLPITPGGPAATGPLEPIPRRRWWPPALGAAALAVLGLALALTGGRSVPVPTTPLPAQAPEPTTPPPVETPSPAAPAIPGVREAYDALTVTVSSILSGGGMTERAAEALFHDADQVIAAHDAGDQAAALEEVLEGPAQVQELAGEGEIAPEWEQPLVEGFILLRSSVEAYPAQPVEEEHGKGRGKDKGHEEND